VLSDDEHPLRADEVVSFCPECAAREFEQD
jgi:hypothetical protein